MLAFCFVATLPLATDAAIACFDCEDKINKCIANEINRFRLTVTNCIYPFFVRISIMREIDAHFCASVIILKWKMKYEKLSRIENTQAREETPLITCVLNALRFFRFSTCPTVFSFTATPLPFESTPTLTDGDAAGNFHNRCFNIDPCHLCTLYKRS